MNSPSEGHFESYIPAAFQHQIEQTYYQKIVEASKFRNLKKDPQFFQDMTKHIGLYSDHGVVHVRDVADRILRLIKRVNGIIIPKRNAERLAFMQVIGVQMAYLHDIGMCNFSAFGRFTHPEFAAKLVFDPSFQELFDLLWQSNAGGVPVYLNHILREQELEQERIRLIYKEILALCFGHSKSKLPVEVLNDCHQLGEHLHWILSNDLLDIYLHQKAKKLSHNLLNEEKQNRIKKLKENLATEDLPQNLSLPLSITKIYAQNPPLSWAFSNKPSVQELFLDIIDTIRCLRAADALRQRGIVLRTSAGYEIFIDRKSAHAIYALHDGDTGQHILLQSQKELNAGEANIAGSEFDLYGNLRIYFHTGHFLTNKVVKRAAKNLALVIEDIQQDVIQSFNRSNCSETESDKNNLTKPFNTIKISLETTPDNPTFTDRVINELLKLNSTLEPRLEEAIPLNSYILKESERYSNGQCAEELLTDPLIQKIQQALIANGVIRKKMNWKLIFRDTVLVGVQKGEKIIKTGNPAGFVYLPLSEGLKVRPLGGYEDRAAKPFLPIGNTSVIRGAKRNADVVAVKALQVLMIPRETYLAHWYQPYKPKEMLAFWEEAQ